MAIGKQDGVLAIQGMLLVGRRMSHAHSASVVCAGGVPDLHALAVSRAQ